ncbi:MAG: TetR/AcrR family transcriptional regulator [Bacteroidota bacterium]
MHILNCAENLMLQHGLDNISMNALAKEAKIAKGTLYLYFKDKEDVITHLTIIAREKLLDLFIEEASKQQDTLDKIEAIFWADFKFYQEYYLYFTLVSNYESNQHIVEEGDLFKSSQKIQVFILSILERARAEKKIKPTIDIASLSLTMWGTCNGMIQLMDTKFQLIKEHTQLDKVAFFRNFVNIIIDGIKQ